MMSLTDRSLKVAAITGGENVPSRRYRIAAIIPYLMAEQVILREYCPKINSYPPVAKLKRPGWLAAALMERIPYVWQTKGFDAVIIQREMISTLHTLERYLPGPLILDVDDAIYLHGNGTAAKKISRLCSLVVCGNDYLAERFSHWNENVVVIPTGVDTVSMKLDPDKDLSGEKIIGWIGTSGNYPYLKSIYPALKGILESMNDVKIQIISDRYPDFLADFGNRLDFRRWRPDIEFELLPRFSVGIMPLQDSEWTRGKCAFKLLQYLAAGIPVVAAPVGMNAQILNSHRVGYSASTLADWTDSIRSLLEDGNQAVKMGLAGRALAEEQYSLNVISKLWKQALFALLAM